MSSSFSLQRCKGVNIVKDIDRKMHEVQDAQRPVLILVAATIVLAFVLAFTGQTFDQKNKGMRSAVESTGIDAPQLRHSDDGKAYTRSLTRRSGTEWAVMERATGAAVQLAARRQHRVALPTDAPRSAITPWARTSLSGHRLDTIC